jgi:hypothetical protein
MLAMRAGRETTRREPSDGASAVAGWAAPDLRLASFADPVAAASDRSVDIEGAGAGRRRHARAEPMNQKQWMKTLRREGWTQEREVSTS